MDAKLDFSLYLLLGNGTDVNLQHCGEGSTRPHKTPPECSPISQGWQSTNPTFTQRDVNGDDPGGPGASPRKCGGCRVCAPRVPLRAQLMGTL